MADLKISALPASTVPLAGTEVLPIVQSSATRQVTVANLTAGRTQTSNGIVQGTAATGYNFTANTPKAGMTSQLLNWYEEGTWTPTATSQAGSITAYTSAGTYTRIGRLVLLNGYVQITTPGTASGTMTILSLPFINGNSGAGGKGQQICMVRESENSGAAYLGTILTNSTNMFVTTLTGTAILWTITNQYTFSATYYTT